MEQTLVRVAHCEVAKAQGVLVTLGLGSCVAILLYDPDAAVAGMAHSLLPYPPSEGAGATLPAKFVSTAAPHLVAEMERLGADRSRIFGRLAGGAAMFPGLSTPGLVTGERNIAAAREALAALQIPIVGEEVGKHHGRSIHFRAEDGHVRVSSYHYGEVIL